MQVDARKPEPHSDELLMRTGLRVRTEKVSWLLSPGPSFCLVPLSATSPRQNLKHHLTGASLVKTVLAGPGGEHPQWSAVWGPFLRLNVFSSHHPSFLICRIASIACERVPESRAPSSEMEHHTNNHLFIPSYHFAQTKSAPLMNHSVTSSEASNPSASKQASQEAIYSTVASKPRDQESWNFTISRR